jgi:hypothetical protein
VFHPFPPLQVAILVFEPLTPRFRIQAAQAPIHRHRVRRPTLIIHVRQLTLQAVDHLLR